MLYGGGGVGLDGDGRPMLYVVMVIAVVMKVLMGSTGYSPVNLQQNIEIMKKIIPCIRRERAVKLLRNLVRSQLRSSGPLLISTLRPLTLGEMIYRPKMSSLLRP